MHKCKEHLGPLVVSPAEIDLSSKIGVGSSSVVYTGKFRFVDVAVKIVAISRVSTKQLRHALSELLFLRRLRHPNVISLLAVSVDEQGNLSIVTELQENHSLRDFLIKNKGKVSLETKLNILFQTARALGYLHSLSPPVMHRDIKPLNIFLGKNLTAKIGDFGLAKEFKQEPKSKINTDTISTLEYMSPESLNQGVY